ncbi:hypothetical protein [Limnospira platensis]|uniref:hypothetical protein n=1 Tax=Limnospira platensis TaxID=118562 RepID=UPI000280405A|nr:hypothetical protein SPLC1_S090210 [Arthrospira platensis C1]UWU51010.1 hypothetical protein APLC1_5967 [Arthrospira platensis C1]
MPGQQTSFIVEDAEQLLTELRRFNDSLKTEWSRVQSQWDNLKKCWHDPQYDEYSPLFEKLKERYQQTEIECEKYIAFIYKQIEITKEDAPDISSVRDKM